jgi:hypothetical protein
MSVAVLENCNDLEQEKFSMLFSEKYTPGTGSSKHATALSDIHTVIVTASFDPSLSTVQTN